MKYLPLLFSGLWCKPVQTVLTTLSVTVAFFIFGLLQAVDAAFNQAVVDANVDRIYVSSRISMAEPLPLAYLERIESVAGVKRVSYSTYINAYYQETRNTIPLRASDPDRLFDIYPEVYLPKDSLDAMVLDRTGAVVGVELAARYHWKVGDRVPIYSSAWSTTGSPAALTFNIVGIFDNPKNRSDTFSMVINHLYFEEVGVADKGMVGMFTAKITDPNQSTLISEEIDKLFANSTHETKTQSEKELAESLLQQVGDISLIVNGIIGAVFFTLIFLTANTMMQSFNERIGELAVLKALGYTDQTVMLLVLSESFLLCSLAALPGLGMASLIGSTSAALMPQLSQVIGDIRLKADTLVWSLSAILLLAVASGLPPAWRARKLTVVEALRG